MGAARGLRLRSLCMLGANLTMVHALVTHDFSVKYVAQVGSRATPLIFTIVSLWSALEGSILFWGAILGVYVFAFTLRPPQRARAATCRWPLGTMLRGGRLLRLPHRRPGQPVRPRVARCRSDGPGPNPLLQNHVLMVIHPPMLYLGYVGMAVPFGDRRGGAAARRARRRVDGAPAPLDAHPLDVPLAWASSSARGGRTRCSAGAATGRGTRWRTPRSCPGSPPPPSSTRRWCRSGSRSLKLWTLSLALASFLLTILGTFMTRSGVFNSVHSFTQSDIGPTFLVFIGRAPGSRSSLLAVRGPLLVAEKALGRGRLARDGDPGSTTSLFAALTFTVLLGTLFPLITRGVLRGKRISVGEPYFNRMAHPAAASPSSS